jgi:hypothetical protein
MNLKRKVVFWLIVSKVSAHVHLISLLLCCGEVEHNGGGKMVKNVLPSRKERERE